MLSLITAVGYWYLTFYPGVHEDQVVKVRWPTHTTSSERHLSMMECFDVRKQARHDGKIAVCTNTAWKIGCCRQRTVFINDPITGERVGLAYISVAPTIIMLNVVTTPGAITIPFKDGDTIKHWKNIEGD